MKMFMNLVTQIPTSVLDLNEIISYDTQNFTIMLTPSSAAYEFHSASKNNNQLHQDQKYSHSHGLLNATSLENLSPTWSELLTLVFKGFIFSTIILGAVLGNALVIISVQRHRKLRVITNYYVVSLAMADMLVALCAMTFNASVELTNGKWLFGYFMCDVWNSLDVYFSTASILHLCCISVDRYYAIVRPLEYPITMTQRTVCFMLANVWLWPALISFTPIFLGWYTTEEHQDFRQYNPNVCIFVVNKYYAIISSSISFWIPGVVMITMYYRIYKEAVRQRKALSRTSSNILLNSVHIHHTSHAMHHSHYLHPSDGDISMTVQQVGEHRLGTVSPNYSTFNEVGIEKLEDIGNPDGVANISDNLNASAMPLSKEVSPRKSVNISTDTGYYSVASNKRNSSVANAYNYRNSRVSAGSAITTRDYSRAATELNTNGTSLRQAGKSWRAEHKAARTLGIIMGTFLLCWLPFFLWYVITTLCGPACNCPDVVVACLFWIGYFNSALNPLIYAYFNRDFRDAFKNTLLCVFPCCFQCWKVTGSSQYV